MTTIVAITGSIRTDSYNNRLLTAAANRLEAAGATVDRIEPQALDLPFYNGDLQATEGIPVEVHDLHTRISAGDGVLIASPEYNGAFSPLLKNTIDWVSRVEMTIFRPRLIGLMGASPGGRGAVHGMGMVDQMFTYMRCVVHRPHFSLPKAGDALDGVELIDPSMADALDQWLAGYLATATDHAEAWAATAEAG